MCENILYFFRVNCVCIIICILLVLLFIFSFCKKKKKNSEEKSKVKFFFDFIKEFIIYISSLLVSLFILFILVWINSRFLNIIPDEKIGEALGLIISATITVSGVFVGYYFNKRQTYVEVVTKERKNWLNNLKDNLSEFMAICEMGLRYTWGKDYCQKKERAIELYYNIIINLNIKDENDRKKILALYHYARFNNLDVTLNFEKAKENGKDDKDLESGTREVLMKQFMDLFKNEWEVVKGEAD